MTTIITTGGPFQSDGDWSMWQRNDNGATEIKMDSVKKAEPMLERHAGQDEEEEMENIAKKALKKVQNMPVKKTAKAKAAKKPAKKLIAKKKLKKAPAKKKARSTGSGQAGKKKKR